MVGIVSRKCDCSCFRIVAKCEVAEKKKRRFPSGCPSFDCRVLHIIFIDRHCFFMTLKLRTRCFIYGRHLTFDDGSTNYCTRSTKCRWLLLVDGCSHCSTWRAHVPVARHVPCRRSQGFTSTNELTTVISHSFMVAN